MIHTVRMNEKTLKAFKDFIDEKKTDKTVTEYINEETDMMNLKALIIKALNALNDISECGLLDQLQMTSYVKPAFEKIMQLRDDIGR